MSKFINRVGGIKFVLPFILGGAFLLTLPVYAGQYYMHILLMVFLNIVLALSYRIFFIAGMGSFGHGAFYCIGAYISALFATRLGLPFPASFLAGGVGAGISGAGLALISRRSKGAYFFLISFAFWAIVYTVAKQWPAVTGGMKGIGGIPPITGCGSLTSYYYMALLFAGVSIFIMYLIDRSRFGHELIAIGDDDDLAEVIGIDMSRYKILAFAIGTLFAGFAGSFFVHYAGYVHPSMFPLWLNCYIILFVVVGGARKLWGPIAGAISLTLTAEILRGTEALQQILLGAILVGVILGMPNGIAGLVDNWRARRTPKQRAEVVDSERSDLLKRFFGLRR